MSSSQPSPNPHCPCFLSSRWSCLFFCLKTFVICSCCIFSSSPRCNNPVATRYRHVRHVLCSATTLSLVFSVLNHPQLVEMCVKPMLSAAKRDWVPKNVATNSRMREVVGAMRRGAQRYREVCVNKSFHCVSIAVILFAHCLNCAYLMRVQTEREQDANTASRYAACRWNGTHFPRRIAWHCVIKMRASVNAALLSLLQSSEVSDKSPATNSELYCKAPKSCQIIPILRSLHWLKINELIETPITHLQSSHDQPTWLPTQSYLCSVYM